VEVFREATRILTLVHGEEAVETAEARLALGTSLLDLGRPEEARPALEAAHSVLLRERGEADSMTRRAAERLADAYQALGLEDDANALRNR
jgi:hypothetical protein